MTDPPYLASIHHDGSSRYVRTIAGREPRLGDEVTIRLRAGLAAPIGRVLLRTCPDGEQQFTEMVELGTEFNSAPNRTFSGACRWWQATLRLTMPVTGYRFLLFTTDGAWWYNGAGPRRPTPTDAEDFRILADYAAPAWVRGSVFYQIFPDRFADGDPGNNVRDGEWAYRDLRASARRWGEPPATGRQAMTEFYGGDLPGIIQKLDYLTDPSTGSGQGLGVNALYLNPIFTAYTNHRYDVVDYDNVDPHLGGNAALADLRRALTERDMRYILDVVPNHCGFLHPWFRAAQADRTAPTAEFFTFRRHPDDYEAWLGVRSLPKLNYRSARLREAIYAGPDAVFRRWLRPPYTADGWRIDVANMLGRQGADQLGMAVAQEVRRAVKETNPAAYLLGEHFFDASPQLQGDCWDAAMNYAGFAQPLWYWLSRFSVNQHGEPRSVTSDAPWPTAALADAWQAHRAAIPWQIARQQLNLLGSHDTRRILATVGGDAARNRLAAGLLLTYVGAACVYYGDEIGLGGADEAAPRICMNWDEAAWDADLHAFYRKLIHLRRAAPALIAGGFQMLAIEEDTLAYLRDSDEEQIIVVAHRGPAGRSAGPLPVSHGAIADGMEFTELFSGRSARVEGGCLPLPAVGTGVTIWRSLGGASS
jgi:alpha-glucosidase